MNQSNTNGLTAAERRIVDELLPAVASVRLDARGRRDWRSAPDVAGKVAAAVIKGGTNVGATRIAQAIGVSPSTMTAFLHGRNTSGDRCAAIVGAIERAGAKPLTRGPGGAHGKQKKPRPATAQSVVREDVADPSAVPVMMFRDLAGGLHKDAIEAGKASRAHLAGRAAETIAASFSKRFAGVASKDVVAFLLAPENALAIAEFSASVLRAEPGGINPAPVKSKP